MSIRNLSLLAALAGITLLAWYFSRQAARTASQEVDFETLIIGTNAEFPPFSFIENDSVTGFDVEVAQEVAQRLGKKVQLKNMSFEALIPEIQLGTIHLIAAGMTPTEQRAKRVFFTKPHFDKDPLVIVQPLHTQKIETPEQLIGKHVIVNQGYTADRYISEVPGIEVTRISSAMISTGLLALQSGKADAYVASQSSLQPYKDKHGTQEFQFTPIQNSEERYALAISKKYPNLYTLIQEKLDEMEKDGTLKSLRNKWKL